MNKTIACLLAACVVQAAPASAADLLAPPAALAGLVPDAFPNGLKLVELRPRCDGCAPWRVIDFHANDSADPVRRERVSVHEGVTAMYAFPGTAYFANVKVEQSILGRYEQDKAIVTEALAHECARMQARVLDYTASRPEVRDKIERVRAKGRDYIEFEQGTYEGIAYASCTHNAFGLLNTTLSQLQIFVPARDAIITAYLLEQKQSKYRSIDEFLQLRRAFIEGYIDAVSKRGGGG